MREYIVSGVNRLSMEQFEHWKYIFINKKQPYKFQIAINTIIKPLSTLRISFDFESRDNRRKFPSKLISTEVPSEKLRIDQKITQFLCRTYLISPVFVVKYKYIPSPA